LKTPCLKAASLLSPPHVAQVVSLLLPTLGPQWALGGTPVYAHFRFDHCTDPRGRNPLHKLLKVLPLRDGEGGWAGEDGSAASKVKVVGAVENDSYMEKFRQKIRAQAVKKALIAKATVSLAGGA
jgi:hypothetical protein